ncbi:MAG: homoserine dehydrogenase [Ruminococcaceae bacterium]|nr:homoserine dehydrogenase [Oscillospiraceae bacterium]
MKIGLLGYGTVGKGVFDILEELNGLEVKYVLDLRELPELGEKLTHDLNVILSDPEVDTVVELIGGMNPAYDFVKKSLLAGKNVVTANKLMVSLHYGELVRLAAEKGVSFRYSASAGGGIPWLVNLQRAHRASRLELVYGIMNGTTNYILDSMTTLGEEFDAALAEAQKLGFAEADPSSDIDGLDTRHKTTLSANVAYGVVLDDEKVDAFGIRFAKKCDIDAAGEAGYALKLFGVARRCQEGIAAYVEPTLVPAETPEGNIHGCDNIIAFEGSYIGKTRFVGAGAGRYPTGYAVVQDLVDIDAGPGVLYNEKMDEAAVNNAAECHAYYVRTDATDDPFFVALEKKPFGAGFATEKVSVRQMHDFAARALAAGKEIFIAGFWN